jgi:hypothetical protein
MSDAFIAQTTAEAKRGVEYVLDSALRGCVYCELMGLDFLLDLGEPILRSFSYLYAMFDLE